MKQEVNPLMVAGVIAIILVVIGVMAWKSNGKSSSGPNPYTANNAPTGMAPGQGGPHGYIGSRSGGPGGSPYSGGAPHSGGPPASGGAPNSAGFVPPSSGGR